MSNSNEDRNIQYNDEEMIIISRRIFGETNIEIKYNEGKLRNIIFLSKFT